MNHIETGLLHPCAKTQMPGEIKSRRFTTIFGACMTMQRAVAAAMENPMTANRKMKRHDRLRFMEQIIRRFNAAKLLGFVSVMGHTPSA